MNKVWDDSMLSERSGFVRINLGAILGVFLKSVFVGEKCWIKKTTLI